MGLAGVRDRDNIQFFDKKPLVVVYYDVDYVRNPKGKWSGYPCLVELVN